MKYLSALLVATTLSFSSLVSAELTVAELVQGATMAVQLERSPTSLTPNQRVEAATALGYVRGYLAGAQKATGKEADQKTAVLLHHILAIAHQAKATKGKLPSSAQELMEAAVKKHGGGTAVRSDTSEKAGDEDEIIAIMKTSVRAGAVREFAFKQVETWKAGEEETHKGVLYRTGLIAYQAETIFGRKHVAVKALIRNGKVEKWVYAKTGLEVR